MQRADLQQLAEDRLADAEALLVNHRWAAAYYLAGYAVECGLKACVLANLATDLGVIFRNKRFSEKCWTHDPAELVDLAGLKEALKLARDADPAFDAYWRTASEWSERSRYESQDERTARDYVRAVGDTTSGVLPWIRRFW